MDLKAIADAIAARFVGVTANGESIGTPTASLPNTIAKGPVLLVYPPTGELNIIMGPRNRDRYDFPVRLLIDPLDVPHRTDMLLAWATAMRLRVEMNMDLDLSYVSQAEAISMRIQLDGETYALSLFDVVELIVQVQINEVVPTVSI